MPEQKIESRERFSFWLSLRQVPKSVWCLGIANFLMNASTILIFSFTPNYLKSVMGVTLVVIGFIEGIGEMLSQLVRVISGVLSDMFHKRKVFILISYIIGTLARPIFPLTMSVPGFVFGKFLDRIANGLAATPREALTADLAPPGLKGACFGVRQAMTTAGSAAGGIIGYIIMSLTNDNYQILFWMATFPAVLGVAVLVFMIEDPRFTQEKVKAIKNKTKKFKSPINLSSLRHFPRAYWMVILVTMVFLMGRFSGVFLLNLATDVGMEKKYLSILMAVFNIMSSISAYPLSALSDRIDRRFALCLGFAFILLADFVLANAHSMPMVILGVVLWGAQFGVTQSIPMAMVADLAPKGLRGTAFGVFYIACGISLYIANTVSGWIGENFGQSYSFLTSASIVILAVIGVWYIKMPPAKVETAQAQV